MTLHLAGVGGGGGKFLHGDKLQPGEEDGQTVLARQKCRVITF